MARFAQHTLESAPEGSREILTQVANNYGFIPNLIATLVESPETTEAYLALGDLFAKTSFDTTEQQVVLLTISRQNGCDYCVAAHSTIAGMQNVPPSVVAAIRNDEPIADSRLEALRQFTIAVTEQRGWVSDEQLEAFIGAGFEPRNVLDVILGSAMKTISNYSNHIANTPLDAAFEGQRFTPAESDAA